jgi:hypothetical protein
MISLVLKLNKLHKVPNQPPRISRPDSGPGHGAQHSNYHDREPPGLERPDSHREHRESATWLTGIAGAVTCFWRPVFQKNWAG